jgi:O-antigen/teichoic acid export membrane protein
MRVQKIPNHIIVASSAWISKILIAFLQVYMVRLLLLLLGKDNYALFAVLTGLMGWFALTDLGLGISLQNHISEYKANQKEYAEIVKNVLGIYFILMILVMILFYFTSGYFSRVILKEFSFLDDKKKNLLFLITGELFIVMNFSSIIYKIWYAELKGYLSNIVPVLGYILSVFGIYILGRYKQNLSEPLVYSILIFLLPNTLITFMLMLLKLEFRKIFFYSIFDKDTIYSIFKKGFNFWFFSIMAAGVLQIDYLVMARYLSSDEIVLYNLLSRIFIFIFFIYSSLLTALWPEIAMEIHKSNIGKVKSQIKKYLGIGILYIIIATLLVILLKDYILRLLAPNSSIKFPVYLIIIIGFYYLIRVWTDTYTMVLQSVNILKPFWIFIPIQALISLFAQIYFVRMYRLNGILYGLILSFLLTVSWGLPYYTRKYIFKKGSYGN